MLKNYKLTISVYFSLKFMLLSLNIRNENSIIERHYLLVNYLLNPKIKDLAGSGFKTKVIFKKIRLRKISKIIRICLEKLNKNYI